MMAGYTYTVLTLGIVIGWCANESRHLWRQARRQQQRDAACAAPLSARIADRRRAAQSAQSAQRKTPPARHADGVTPRTVA